MEDTLHSHKFDHKEEKKCEKKRTKEEEEIEFWDCFWAISLHTYEGIRVHATAIKPSCRSEVRSLSRAILEVEFSMVDNIP